MTEKELFEDWCRKQAPALQEYPEELFLEYEKELEVTKRRLLYHGSCAAVVNPTFGGGEENCDFGPGFYLTPELQKAYEWSCIHSDVAYVHVFILDMSNLVRYVFGRKDYIKYVATMSHYRGISKDSAVLEEDIDDLFNKYGVDLSAFDIVGGLRADDSYQRFMTAFLSNMITDAALYAIIERGKLGRQLCVKSTKAYTNLHEIAILKTPSKYLGKYKLRVDEANAAFESIRKTYRHVGKRLHEIL